MEPRIESIYLYREVESEAIRLLLPMADFDIDAQRASFKAALEFGLRRRYGGRAPHLQVKAMREPIRGGGHRNYLVLFDSVPGGTGFLADLWREDALMSVLEDALKGLNACKCVGENKDGCYLCLFAYQNQRDMAVTSSSVARRLLDDIVKKKSTLSDVDTLSDVVLDTKLESELEERFLRTLIARAKKGGEVRKILRAGDERWELQFGEHRWEVRQQVLLGATQGVSEQTRADFVITPLTTSGDPRPIAVYCDGLAYHVCPDEEHSKLGDDVRKRRSIIESGRYLVWSLTWKDVDEFGVGEEEAAPTLLDVAASGPGGAVLKRWGLHAESSLAKKGSMELLWDWLAEPDRALWDRRLAALGAQFVVRQTTLTSSAIESLEEALFLQSLPLGSEAEAVSVKASTETLGNAEGLFGLKLLGRLSMSACRGSEPISPIWTLRLYDDRARRSDPQFHSSWRAFLQAINLLQFVPDFLFATTEDVEARHDEGAGIYLLKREEKSMQMVAERPGPVAPADPLAGLHLLDEEKSLVRGVLDSGGPLPEVGFELLDATGRCIAEAPLAWVSARVAVVFGVELSDLAVFDRAGWRVFGPSEVDELIAVLRASDAERGA
jgi:DEAD/DEAH box helicase domain-containing protein